MSHSMVFIHTVHNLCCDLKKNFAYYSSIVVYYNSISISQPNKENLNFGQGEFF